MENLKEWYNSWGKKMFYTLLVVVSIYLFIKYIFELVAPFIFAWLFSIMLAPIVAWLAKRFRVPRAMGTLLSMATVLCTVLSVIGGIGYRLYEQAKLLKDELPALQMQAVAIIDEVEMRMQALGKEIPLPEALQSFDELMKQVVTYISGCIDQILTAFYSVITAVPNIFFFVIIMFIATFFMTKDHLEIKRFVKAQIPDHVTDKIVIMQRGLKNALGGYVKTQLILMCFTFTICLIGLFVLGRRYALVIALGIAVLDALPVFGSGAVLIPWGIYNLIMGDFAVGIGLLSIYALIVVMRQIIEPKVLSTQIGVYALVTVMAMYIGLKTIGVFGMIIGPVIVVMFKTLQTLGIIPPFKEVNKS